MNDYKLDNPVWYSLSESHSRVGVDYGPVKFYRPDYCPFGGFSGNENLPACIQQYSRLTDNFFIVGKEPVLPPGLKISKELVCLQMVAEKQIEIQEAEAITLLTHQHHHALFQLVNLVQPGYFREKTALLGDYVGIFKNGELVAVSGERMKMNEFTEVSAVVTHPQYTGRGYASQLTARSLNNILGQNKLPYLHVVEKNTGAIQLYEKLGFKARRRMSFWHITN